jgi:transcriptional regulator GlxA family with amidase domain
MNRSMDIWSLGERDAILIRLRPLASASGYKGPQLAHFLGVSSRHLLRLFSRHLACTPQTWLTEQRLLDARHLLQTASSVKQVAHTLGYRKVSQFSRDFRRRFGVSPSAVRRLPPEPAAVTSAGAESQLRCAS